MGIAGFYTSTEAAEECGTTPRLLRRFIRQNDSWKNATQAGRYTFTESEMKSLKIQFENWQKGRQVRPPVVRAASEELEYLDEDKGFLPEVLDVLHKNPALRKHMKEKRLERQRKLDARIIECGLRKEQNA